MSPAPQTVSFLQKSIACALSGIWFALLYNLTNYAAAAPSRAHLLGTWYADWELNIPVVAPLIIPYWSIDILFVVGFLLCTSKAELDLLTRRIVFAIAIAGLFFTFMPLQLGFVRGSDYGIWTPFFTTLFSFDQTHNLFPSLHVTFVVIFRWTFAKHIHGPWRWLMHIWFFLISASTIFVHQHHLIDILGGVCLAAFVMYLFDEKPINAWRIQTNARSKKLSAAYGLGSVCLVYLASHGSWYLLFWWPAFSLCCVSLAYGGLGSAICRPRAAGPSYPARFLLFAWLEVLGWSRRIWWRKPFPSSEIRDNVWIGRLCDVPQWNGAVIDCTCEHRRRRPASGTHERIPMLDLCIPEQACLDHIAERIEQCRQNGPVLVVCGLGLGRSALSVAAWLVSEGHAASIAEAKEIIAEKRPVKL